MGPMLWLLGTDLLRRHEQIARFDTRHRLGYAGGWAESLVLWSVLLYVASRRGGALRGFVIVPFVVLFTLAAGIEGAFHRTWNTYLTMEGQIHSKSVALSFLGNLPFHRASVLLEILVACALSVGFVLLARKLVRPRPIPRLLSPLLVPAVIAGAAVIPVSYHVLHASPPDALYIHGMWACIKENLDITNESPDLRVQRRSPMPVPRLSPKPKRERNVVLILQESERADVACIEYEPGCDLATRSSNEAAPKRMPLLQMRAHDSTTAISISNIWSGVRPTEPRELLHSVPLLWEYAAAAGWDTAYWTSQNLMFGNARLFVQDIPASHFAVATHLDPLADLDAGAYDTLLTDRVIRDWDEMKEPFFAVVHYSNVHFPYVYDPENAPFQPASFSKGPEKNNELVNYYKNVVYLSDLAVGRLIRHIRATDKGKRTVLVYTSDHGESFREHWQMGHTSALYDEEIRVPSWIDAPEGTLAPEEEQSIHAARDEFVWHLDLAPTFLDLMGVWDDPALLPFRRRMIGHPLTRPERTVAPVPLTNCTWVWECAFRNWGMMQGPLKLSAREWDGEYHCFDLRTDPEEANNLGEAACGSMSALARDLFHVMPNVTPPGRPRVDWGK
jgi:glucan phosphoethanolaminetransferase (alkaline phosphatase superfamily)